MAENIHSEAKPEKLIPHHLSREGGRRGELAHQIGTDIRLGLPEEQINPLRNEYQKTREQEISMAPDLDTVIRREAEVQGIELEPNVNYGLKAILKFQENVRTAQDLRRVIRASEDPQEVSRAAIEFSGIKKNIDSDIDTYGPSFEKSYRDYLRGRLRYIKFNSTRERIKELEVNLGEPAFEGYPDSGQPDVKARSRLEVLSRKPSSKEPESEEEVLNALKSVYPEESDLYQRLVTEIRDAKDGREPNPIMSKAETREEIDKLQAQAQELWDDGMVQYFWKIGKWNELLDAFSRGEDVLEMPSTIHNLNLLNEWEQQHQRTTIGGVLVGPPGVGKTTLVRHYLELKGRDFTYIDLSEDVTRYLLFGSKALEFKNPTEAHEKLAERISAMDEEEFGKFVDENAIVLAGLMGISADNAKTVTVAMLEEFAGKSGEEDGQSALKQKVEELARHAYRKELGSEFAHLIKKNGWRDGVIIAALRRGDSIIMDEFNKNANWSLIYSLLTAKPGENWYFAENDEQIHVPKNWRMYFTANIGRRHKTFAVAEALASRAEGKIMEIDYPTEKEEMDVALAALSDAEGNFLRSQEDLAKLFYTVNNLFSQVRKYIEDKPSSIPISYRTIRDLGEKLILYNSPESGKPVFRATDKSFDQALYEILVESGNLYEDKTVPEQIVRFGVNTGLFLTPELEEKIVEWIGKDEYGKAKEAFSGKKEDYSDIVRKIRGVPDVPESADMLLSRNF